MTSKVCVITGGNSGIGKATAIELAKSGIELIILARDSEKSAKAVQEIIDNSSINKVSHIKVDFTDMASIISACDEINSKHSTIDYLINNAGVFKRTFSNTSRGCEETFAVNYLAPFIISRKLAGLLSKSDDGRIMNVTSALYKRGKMYESIPPETSKFNGNQAYSDSKLMVLLDTLYLAQSDIFKNVSVNCVHPGVVGTDVFREYPKWFAGLLNLFLTKPEKAGESLAALTMKPDLSDKSGLYFNIDKSEAVQNAEEYLSDYRLQVEKVNQLLEM